jgi:L-histidine Nalpha-methyltransferase
MTAVALPPTFDVLVAADWARRALIDDVRQGLGRHPLKLSPRWLYDARGSALFDRITRLVEYYPTEAERQILRREAASIADLTRADTIIELGSGTSDKTRTLLDAFAGAGQLRRFVPFDVSESTLRDAAAQLSTTYPGLQVHGLVGDFTLHLSQLPTAGIPLVAFLGSTIGNLYVEERQAFLSMLAEQLPDEGWLLLGVDLVKPIDRLVTAYDDPHGVTAEFTRNLLHVLNHELGANFDVDAFDHVALWDPLHERMDLRLRVNGDQLIDIPDADVGLQLHDGEEIRVEISSKFRIPRITAEVEAAGFRIRQLWTDPRGDFALILASVARRPLPPR